MAGDAASLTPFELTLESDPRWKFVYDEVTGGLIGYVRRSSGFTQMVDRGGKVVFQDEVGIQPSLLSPIDLIGPAMVVGAFSRLTGRGAVSLARLVAGAGTRKGAANLAASSLRAAAQTAARQAAPATGRQALIEAIVRQFPLYGRRIRDLCKFCNDGALMNIAKALGVLPK